MSVPIHVGVKPYLEICLALAARPGGAQLWHLAAGLVADLTEPPSLAGLADALDRVAAANEIPAPQRHRLATELRAFLPGFAASFQTKRAAYDAAAARLAEKLAGTMMRRDVDLGALFGLPLALEPHRRGLRAGDGHVRLAANRLHSIELIPTAFNTAGFWHLGPAAGGRHAALLPCHDATLAAVMATTSRQPPTSRKLKIAEAGDPEIAHLCTALGDTSRRSIAQLLARETLSAAALGRRLDLSPPAISHHLAELRKAGLISELQIGARRDLSLNRAAFDRLGERLLAYLAGTTDTKTSRRRR